MAVNSLVIFVIMVTVTANLPLASPLRITNFYVPRRAHNQVEIDCKYDLEGRQLYAVKWYKDGEEFLRCTANGDVLEFTVTGVTTRHSSYATVGSCPLTLVATSPKSAGDYVCEVSLDTPDFAVARSQARLDLLMPPRTQDLPQKEAKGTEKRTSDEENDQEKSSGYKRSENLVILLLLFSISIVINNYLIKNS